MFAGVGNIIKNEVLFRIRVHPCSKVGALPPAKLPKMVEEARIYNLTIPGVEAGLRAEETLAGPQQGRVPAL